MMVISDGAMNLAYIVVALEGAKPIETKKFLMKLLYLVFWKG